jgi:hypothetical protein
MLSILFFFNFLTAGLRNLPVHAIRVDQYEPHRAYTLFPFSRGAEIVHDIVSIGSPNKRFRIIIPTP